MREVDHGLNRGRFEFLQTLFVPWRSFEGHRVGQLDETQIPWNLQSLEGFEQDRWVFPSISWQTGLAA